MIQSQARIIPVVLVLLLLFISTIHAILDADIFPPTCGGCYCVLDDNTKNGSCRSPTPRTEFNFTEQLKQMVWKNPIQLECNPYLPDSGEDCTLTDFAGNNVEVDLGEDAVCGIQYDETQIKNNNCFRSYVTQSFANRQQAETAGFFVTHLLPCGTCSSTQDLAVYIETPNLQGAGIQCGLLALSNETAAWECYQAIGFSPACAKTWLHDTSFTRDNCLDVCLANLNAPPNLNVSNCPLNDCINCNEEISGPIFKRIAGRTRRGSGLLSYIIRNCSELVTNVGPIDPCTNGFIEDAEDDDFVNEPGSDVSDTRSVGMLGGDRILSYKTTYMVILIAGTPLLMDLLVSL